MTYFVLGVAIVGALFIAARVFGRGPLSMNGEGPRPTFCRQCGTRLLSRDASGPFDPHTGRACGWEQLYCPQSAAHWTWSYHWTGGWQEDWDV